MQYLFWYAVAPKEIYLLLLGWPKISESTGAEITVYIEMLALLQITIWQNIIWHEGVYDAVRTCDIEFNRTEWLPLYTFLNYYWTFSGYDHRLFTKRENNMFNTRYLSLKPLCNVCILQLFRDFICIYTSFSGRLFGVSTTLAVVRSCKCQNHLASFLMMSKEIQFSFW